jgi:hypothetical protein
MLTRLRPPRRRRRRVGLIAAIVASAALASAQFADVGAVVDAVLESYRVALEQKDLDQLGVLYVNFSERQREALQQYLASADGLNVELSDVRIAPLGDGVAVSYTRRDTFVDRDSGKPQRLEVRLTKILVPDGTQWKIRGGS